jgi:hypothetical protein
MTLDGTRANCEPKNVIRGPTGSTVSRDLRDTRFACPTYLRRLERCGENRATSRSLVLPRDVTRDNTSCPSYRNELFARDWYRAGELVKRLTISRLNTLYILDLVTATLSFSVSLSICPSIYLSFSARVLPVTCAYHVASLAYLAIHLDFARYV